MKKHWKIILVLSLLLNLATVYVAYKALEYRAHINEYLHKYLHLIDEFSGRDVYADENSTMASDTTVPGRVVFFGTQVTSNWDVARYFPEYEAVNRGVDHQWVHGFLMRFRPDVIRLGPEAVVVEISSYNLRPQHDMAEIRDHVRSMAELARIHGIDPILTTIVAPVAGTEVLEHPEYRIADSVAAYNRWIRAYADSAGYALADIHAAVSDSAGALRSEMASSKVDLSDAGYAAVSAVVRAALRVSRELGR